MNPSNAPRYVVYCDESRFDPCHANTFMGIGGLWVPLSERTRIQRRLREIADAHGLAEAKWSKVSTLKLRGYQELVDVFMDEPALSFRIILVDNRQLDNDVFHDGSSELGFYKFYYRMLEKWLQPDREYVVLLDHRVNSSRGRHTELQGYLQRKVGERTRIRRVDPIDSHESRLAQLCDVLTGAITAAWCDGGSHGAKQALQQHLAGGLGRSLRSSDPLPDITKLNIFQIRLAQTPISTATVKADEGRWR